jgi:hypothetical protein
MAKVRLEAHLSKVDLSLSAGSFENIEGPGVPSW